MLYEIIVYQMKDTKKAKVYAKEVQADNAVLALDRACVRFTSSRIVEIRELPHPKYRYPRVTESKETG